MDGLFGPHAFGYFQVRLSALQNQLGLHSELAAKVKTTRKSKEKQ